MKKLTPTEKELVSFVPNKVWFSLQECCDMKGVNIHTMYNHKELQPNKGHGCMIGGRKQFRKDEVILWLLSTDDVLKYSR